MPDRKKDPRKVDRNAIRLFIEIGAIGIILGLILSILSEAIYEAITGIDPTLEFAFYVFWVSFAIMFFLIGLFAYRIALSFGAAGYRVSPGGLIGWFKRRIRRIFRVRNLIGITIIAVIAILLSALAAFILALLIFVARNQELFFPTMMGS